LTKENAKEKNIMKTFNVTFNTIDKYHPVTRTVSVNCHNAGEAKDLVGNQFGSFNKDKELKKITISAIEEVIKETPKPIEEVIVQTPKKRASKKKVV
jgi:hypothetical protein